MKILSISGSNLNSLRADFEVDFTAGSLKDCGIFAITGPTGAGKTTLLDTITLALYGKTPRSAKDDDIISYGAGEARATVVFQTAEGRFKSEWKVRRARSKYDGAIQQSSMELSHYPKGDIITHKKREAQEKIKELIKLEYDQFLKSVLLAQGAFKAFLDADDKERGEMLEKISDTSLYTTLSKRAFDRKRTEEGLLSSLREKVGNVVLLGSEERQLHENQINTLNDDLGKSIVVLNEYQKKLNWLVSIGELTQKQLAAEADVATAIQKLELEKPNLLRWESHQQIAGLELPWTQYQHKIEEIAQQEESIEVIRKKILALAEKLQSAENSRLSAEKLFAEAVKNREERLHLALGAIERKTDLLLEQQQLNALQEKQKAKLKEGLECKLRSEKMENKLSDDKLLIDDLAEWITKHQQYAEAGNSHTKTSLLVSQIKRSKSDMEKFESVVLEANEKVSEIKNAFQLAEQNEQQAELDQEILKTLENQTALELGKLKNRVIRETEENNLALDITAGLLEAQQNSLSRQEFLSEHLSKLHEGESCPLCGSAEHPNQTLSIEDVQAEISMAKILIKQYQNTSRLNRAKQKTNEAMLTNLEHIVPADQTPELKEQNFDEVFKALINQQRSIPQKQHAASLMHAAAIDLKWSLTEKLADLAKRKAETTQSLVLVKCHLDSQLKDLEEIAGLYQLRFETNHPDRLPDTLKKYADEFNAKSKEDSAVRRTVPAMEEGVETLKMQITGLRKDLLDLNEEIEKKSTRVQTYRDEIVAAHAGYSSPEKARDALISAEKLAGEQLTQTVNLLNKIRNEEGKIIGEKENAELSLETLTGSFKSLGSRLKTSLAELGLEDDINLIKEGLLVGHEKMSLGNLYKSIHDKLLLAQAQAEKCKGELELQQSLQLTEENIESITLSIRAVSSRMQEMNQELGQRRQILKEDDDKQDRIQSIKKEIENQENILRKWAILSNLIGSADGKKFNQFAQGLTLDRLLVVSNHHLQLLNDRYLLKRNINVYGLGLRIIDQYQADNEREINTLSGGESFLVSLALALGLSEMTSKLTTIDSLFIDEGFGTLDADTLEVALTALRGLQIGGKTIGIISHVERLKEEIYTQVEITKGSDGFSTLKVIPETFS